ncbi:hypothetical protein ZHAS_00007317 [Anopheles sinensis]|uniref:Uncharacterized protein n=1 Tax=Anopheles sinensis TaxID=74873 RepID=A0A084VPP1_ANOSI|nr:hypothetical protein ZHAS_00007317 [Anopheles sinensis]
MGPPDSGERLPDPRDGGRQTGAYWIWYGSARRRDFVFITLQAASFRFLAPGFPLAQTNHPGSLIEFHSSCFWFVPEMSGPPATFRPVYLMVTQPQGIRGRKVLPPRKRKKHRPPDWMIVDGWFAFMM